MQKSYRAIRHDVIRAKQKEYNQDVVHHELKTNQINFFLNNKNSLQILELFSGSGALTDIYKNYGSVIACDKKNGTGDSFRLYHKFIYENKKFDVIDIDSFGFPNRFLPDIYLLIDSGLMFVTLPIPSINILHDITKTHLFSYYGLDNPSITDMANKIALMGLSHWRKVSVIDILKCNRVYRLVLEVLKVKSTEYTGIKNR